MSENEMLKLAPDPDPEDPERWRTYCLAIAGRILGSGGDAEECVSEVMVKAWEIIPVYRPVNVKTFLGRLTRNTAINMRKSLRAQKRGTASCMPLSELSEIVSGADDPEDALIRKELLAAVNDFLGTLPAAKRDLFVLRYWNFESAESLATRFGTTEKNIYVQLHRLREKLKKYLKEKEYFI